MCEECEKFQSTTRKRIDFIKYPSRLYDLIREKNIEEAIKINGCLRVTERKYTSDNFTRDGVFIEEKKLQERIKEYIKKYNPQGLSFEEYRRAYMKEELPWQREEIH